MSLRNENVSAASLAFGVHCSVFKKRFPDRRARRRLTSEGHAPSALTGTRPRSSTWVEGVGVNVPPFRARGKRATGVRGDWQDYRRVLRVSNSARGKLVGQRRFRLEPPPP